MREQHTPTQEGVVKALRKAKDSIAGPMVIQPFTTSAQI
jgi:hypothetical protein